MGEVRVKVKLTNSFDTSNFRRGLIKKDEIRVYEADALIDTGAVSSVVPANVMQMLGVLPIGFRLLWRKSEGTGIRDGAAIKKLSQEDSEQRGDRASHPRRSAASHLADASLAARGAGDDSR